jgi:photosystem II stability/assembly factor-like uncharacterized protein
MTIHTPLLLLRAALVGGIAVGALASSSPAQARIVVSTTRTTVAVSPVAPTFVDINPDNEDAGTTECKESELCVSQQNGGRVNGLAVVPDDPNVYFAASEVGGLFKSTDGGSSWTHLDGHLPTTTWDVAVEPGGQRVFATSFNEGRVDTAAPLQVSTDGGLTWSGRLPAAPSTCDPARAAQPSAFGIALRPGTSEVLVGTNCGLVVSNQAGDKGTWTRFDPTPDDDEPSPVWDIVALPGGKTYACGDDGLLVSNDGQPGPSWKKLESTPPTPLPGGFCSLAVSPDDSNVVFVVFARGSFGGDGFAVGCCEFPPGTGAEFFEGHIDADKASVALTPLPYPDDIYSPKPDPYPNTVTKKGRVPFVVTNKRSQGYDLWVGDGSLWRVPCVPDQSSSCPAAIDTSQWDGSFTDHLGGATKAHGDSSDLEFDPAVSVDACPTLYSSDGGVYLNTDKDPKTCFTPSFEGANTGLHAFLLWDMEGVHADKADDEDIYFSTQDNGLFYTGEAGKCGDPSTGQTCSWMHPTGGDEMDVAADEKSVLASRGGELRKADRGYVNPVWLIRSGLGPIGVPGQLASVGSGEFLLVVPPNCCNLDQDGVPTDPIPMGVRDLVNVSDIKQDVSYFGTEVGGYGSWAKKSSLPPCHIVVSQRAEELRPQPYVLAGACGWPYSMEGRAAYAADQLWTYRDGRWEQIPVPTQIDGVATGATGFGLIAVDPVNPNRLYASVVGSQPPLMVRSTDGGDQWARDDALTNLMSANGRFIAYPGVNRDQIWPYQQPLMVAFDPDDPNILVAGGASSGVFISSDGGESWSLLTDPFTPGTSPIQHLPRPLWAHFDHDTAGVVRIYLGTGRGVWRVEVPEADAAIVSFAAVTSPSKVLVGQPVELTLRKVVTNHGPSAPVNITVARTATAPSGSNVTPTTSSETVTAVAKDELRTIDETFTITCGAPGLQTFSFGNRIHPASPAYVDPNPTNNSAAAQVTVECVLPVAVNIKPGGFPNAINLKGTAPVAVLTTAAGEYGLPLAFDATTIDPASVRFGSATLVFSGTGGAAPIHGAGHIEDSYELDETTRDGDLDMVLQFRVADSDLTSSSTEGCVSGSYHDAGGASRRFFGCDSVKISP